MERHSVTSIARNQLEYAVAAKSGRAAQTIYGGSVHVLRQTIVALRAGSSMDEHDNPGEATIHVLSGRVVLSGNSGSWEMAEGVMLIVPKGRNSVKALEDSTLMLTVAKLK